MKFSGIDLHSNNSVVLISDEADRIVYQKRLPNDLAQTWRHWSRIGTSWWGWSSKVPTTGTGWSMG